MPTVTISPKYQVVIPREVREALNLKPGEKVQVFPFGDHIELIPVRKLPVMRGLMEGFDAAPRDKGRG